MDAHAVMAGIFGSVGVVLVALLMRTTIEQRWFLPFGLVVFVISLIAFATFPALAAAMHWSADGPAAYTYVVLSDLPDFGIVLMGAWLLNRFVLRKK